MYIKGGNRETRVREGGRRRRGKRKTCQVVRLRTCVTRKSMINTKRGKEKKSRQKELEFLPVANIIWL